MKKHEIGSEFSVGNCHTGENHYLNLSSGEKRYVLSGRTALAHITDDIKVKSRFSCAALPAYCCGSMVASFYNKRIEVIFYRGIEDRNILAQADVVLVMDYFGFSNPETIEIVQFCKDLGKTVIVDATQTAFSKMPTYPYADYWIASHRKWVDSLSASVYCREGFAVPACGRSSEEYTAIWRQAAQEKTDYLRTGAGDKQHFLKLYGEASHALSDDYENRAACAAEIAAFEQIDSYWLREKRRENASFLLEKLRKESCQWMRPLFPELGEEDCPLFVPVLLDTCIRAAVRKELIGRDIYCPIHWPVEHPLPNEETELHRTELSLICDQRYSIEDMQRQIEALITAVKHASQGLQ